LDEEFEEVLAHAGWNAERRREATRESHYTSAMALRKRRAEPYLSGERIHDGKGTATRAAAFLRTAIASFAQRIRAMAAPILERLQFRVAPFAKTRAVALCLASRRNELLREIRFLHCDGHHSAAPMQSSNSPKKIWWCARFVWFSKVPGSDAHFAQCGTDWIAARRSCAAEQWSTQKSPAEVSPTFQGRRTG